MLHQDRLKGQHVRLRALGQADLPDLMRWENDPMAWSSSKTINPLSPDFIQSYITSSTQHILETGCMGFVIELIGTAATAVGHLMLYDYSAIHRRLALGLYIAPEHRGRGYAREALSCAISYAFEQLRCEQIYAEILRDNAHSRQMVKDLGFVETACLPRWHWDTRTYQDLFYYQKWNE